MTAPKNGQPRQRPTRMVSPKTAQFLLQVLDSLTLQAGAPDFDEVAALISAARRELRPIAGPAPKPAEDSA